MRVSSPTGLIPVLGTHWYLHIHVFVPEAQWTLAGGGAQRNHRGDVAARVQALKGR